MNPADRVVKRVALAGALASLALGLAATGVASAQSVQAVQTISYASFSQSHPYESSVIARAGEIAVANLQEGRSELVENRYSPARRRTAHAIHALKLVHDASPSLRLADGIGALHDRLVSGAGANPEDLTPIYGQLDAYATVSETTAVRASLDRARSRLGAGQVKEAVAALEDAQAHIVYVETDIPVRNTLLRTSRALGQIGRKEWLGAEATLGAALNGLDTFTEKANIDVDRDLVADVELPD